jgi:hypothetical protein
MASKFDAFLGGAKERVADEAPPSPAPIVEARRKPRSSTPATPSDIAHAGVSTRRGPGRPPGKKTDNDFVQVTIYIKDETHRAVKKALLDEPRKKDFSDLVEDCLSKWLRARG